MIWKILQRIEIMAEIDMKKDEGCSANNTV